MRRILVVHCPIVRSTAGNSLGPMTISATMAMMTYSDHSMPNTRVISTPRRDDDRGHRADNDKLYRAVLNTASLLQRPPLPLGDRIDGNSVPLGLVACGPDGRSDIRVSRCPPGEAAPDFTIAQS